MTDPVLRISEAKASATVAPRKLLCCLGECHCDGKLTVSHPCVHVMEPNEFEILGQLVRDYYNRARFGSLLWSRVTDIPGLCSRDFKRTGRVLDALCAGGYVTVLPLNPGNRKQYRPTPAGRVAWWANTPEVRRGTLGITQILGGNE